MTDDSGYLLGHDEDEWARLQAQHVLWRGTLLPRLERLSPSAAQILEVGCGSGALLADLAELAAGGCVVGVERDASAAERAAAVVGSGARVLVGDLDTVALPEGNDLAVARWVFSFLPDVERSLARLAAAVKPGGHVVVQDYNHEGFGIWPSDPIFPRVIRALREAYAATGGDLWVAARLPEIAARVGLELVEIEPHVKAGAPGTPVWSWVESFLLTHTPNLVGTGHLSAAELSAFTEAWSRTRAGPGAMLFSPIVATVVMRRS